MQAMSTPRPPTHTSQMPANEPSPISTSPSAAGSTQMACALRVNSSSAPALRPANTSTRTAAAAGSAVATAYSTIANDHSPNAGNSAARTALPANQAATTAADFDTSVM